MVALGTVTAIVDADIDPGAAIQFSKILATGIDASLFVGFPNAQAAAGKWPFANLPVPFGATYVSLVSIPNTSLLPLTLASWVDGGTFKNLASIPSAAGQVPYTVLVASLASGSLPIYNGVNTFVGSTFPSQKIILVSTTSFSGVTNSGDIAITSTNSYLVRILFTSFPNDLPALRFNNDAGTVYKYWANGYSYASATAINIKSSAAAFIQFPSVSAGAVAYLDFYINPQDTITAALPVHIYGNIQGSSINNADQSHAVAGKWANTAVVTSFRMLTSGGGNMDGTIYLYQIKTS